MDILNTYDLVEERNDLQEQILDVYKEEFSEVDDFNDIDFDDPHKDYVNDIDIFLEQFELELLDIDDINELEDVTRYSGDSFENGIVLINEDDWEQFVEDYLEKLGYTPKDFPSWIVIDWYSTANNVREDYTEVGFRGQTYLYR